MIKIVQVDVEKTVSELLKAQFSGNMCFSTVVFIETLFCSVSFFERRLDEKVEKITVKTNC